jgi:DNA polymerase
VDLKSCGAYEYAIDDSTKILCVAYRIGTRKNISKAITKVWTPFIKIHPNFGELLQAFLDEKVILVAHNAFFEQVITRFVFSKLMYSKEYLRNIPRERWICTASLAAALALPRSLDGACNALNLPIKKDMDGHKLMMKMCKPRKISKKNLSTWWNSLPDLKRLMEYCKTDIDAETQLFLTLPPLNETERKIWLLDQKINFRGFKVDRDLVLKILGDIMTYTAQLKTEVKELTGLESTNQTAKVLSFLKTLDIDLPNLQEKTVSDILKDESIYGVGRRILEIRQALSKSSTAKYSSLELRSKSDSRVRDILMYHGASTGRWSGRGSQIQNFPRSCPKNIEDIVKDIKEMTLDDIELFYGNPLKLFSNILKGTIIPENDKHIFNCADYSAIEARVLFWMSKHEKGIESYLKKRDIYREMATKIYGVSLLGVTEEMRQVGKRAILGCGYGMGHKKFEDTCKQFGQEVSESLAKKAIVMYRTVHRPVVSMWSNLEKAAIAAVSQKGKKFNVNYTTWYFENNFLFCELPSKRRLAYYGPEIHYDGTPWGDKRATLHHYGMNPKSNQWELSNTYGGRLTENVVSGMARDIMAAAMLRLDSRNYLINFTVHDEILAESEKDDLNKFLKIMTDLPDWAAGCPITAEGWTGRRYRK